MVVGQSLALVLTLSASAELQETIAWGGGLRRMDMNLEHLSPMLQVNRPILHGGGLTLPFAILESVPLITPTHLQHMTSYSKDNIDI